MMVDSLNDLGLQVSLRKMSGKGAGGVEEEEKEKKETNKTENLIEILGGLARRFIILA